jgi:hypothetical protein
MAPCCGNGLKPNSRLHKLGSSLLLCMAGPRCPGFTLQASHSFPLPSTVCIATHSSYSVYNSDLDAVKLLLLVLGFCVIL